MGLRHGPGWLTLLAVCVAGVALGAAPTGAQEAGVTASVTPDHDLVDGDEVTITMAGLASGSRFYAAQCASPVVDGFESCDLDDLSAGTAGAEGTATVTLRVDAMLDLFQPDQVDCRPSACGIAVIAASDFSIVAEAPLAFGADGPLAPPAEVTVVPDTGIADGQTVTVSVTGMVWRNDAVVFACPAAALDTCEAFEGRGLTVTDGAGSVELPARAVVDGADGPVDCREPGACVVVVSPRGNYVDGKAGTAPITFDPDTVVTPVVLSVEPSADLVDDQQVTVTGSGFGTSGWVEVYQCAPDPAAQGCQWIDFSEVPSDGTFSSTVRVRALLDTGLGRVDCRTAGPCLLVTTPTGSPSSARAGRAELAFRLDGPLAPGPAVTVTPGGPLPDPASITVSATGLGVNGYAQAAVCAAGQPFRCDPETRTSADVGAGGTFGPVTIGVAATFTADDGNAVDCRAASGCEVAVEDFDRARTGTAPLAFAPPAPPGGGQRYREPVFDDVTVTRDVEFGGGLRLDIYEPAGDTAAQRPVVAWLAGGWFEGRSRDDMAPYADAFARRGYVAVTVDYRARPGLNCCPTTDAAGVTAALLDAHDDGAAAVAWLRAHAAEHRIDPDAIAIGGAEAGGSAALALAHLPGQMGRSGPSPVGAAIGISSVDLGRPDAGEPAVLSLHGDDTRAPLHLAEWSCARAARVGARCEAFGYLGAFDIATSRRRDIVQRSSDFLAATMLVDAGYLQGPAAPPAPAAAAATTTTPTGATRTTPGRGTLPRTGAGTTGPLVAVAVGLGALGAALVVTARARRLSDRGDMRIVGAIAVGAVTLLVIGAVMTADSPSGTRSGDDEQAAGGHDMSAHDDEHGDEHGDDGHGDDDHGDVGGTGDDHDMTGHGAAASGSGRGHTTTGVGHGTSHAGTTSGGHRHGAGSGSGSGSGGAHDGEHAGGHPANEPAAHDPAPHDPAPQDPGGHDPGGHDPDPHDPTDPSLPPEPPDDGFEDDWTPEQVAFAQRMIDETAAALPAYGNVAILPLLGYVWIFDGTQVGQYQHWISLSRISDPRILDPATPESLVFRTTEDGPVLEAAMYMLTPGVTLSTIPPDIAWFPGWHVHDNLCFDGSFRVVGLAVNGVCERGSLIVTPPMVHVWIVDTPCGRFAGVDENGLQCDHHHDTAMAVTRSVTRATTARGGGLSPPRPAQRGP
jgi:acetyl esterase/lipase